MTDVIRLTTLVGAFLVAGLISIASVASVAAQPYPPAEPNSIVLSASPTEVAVGGTSTLSANVLDDQGDPISGVEVTFTIVSEPGDDAAVGSKLVTKDTNALGVATATLQVGSTPGQIVIEAISGQAIDQTAINVAPSPVASPTPPGATPPGATPAGATPAGLPAAGAGFVAESDDAIPWMVVIPAILAGLGMASIALFWMRRGSVAS